jgi:hypothetical protein
MTVYIEFKEDEWKQLQSVLSTVLQFALEAHEDGQSFRLLVNAYDSYKYFMKVVAIPACISQRNNPKRKLVKKTPVAVCRQSINLLPNITKHHSR